MLINGWKCGVFKYLKNRSNGKIAWTKKRRKVKKKTTQGVDNLMKVITPHHPQTYNMTMARGNLGNTKLRRRNLKSSKYCQA